MKLLIPILFLLAPIVAAQTSISSNFQPAASSISVPATDAPVFEFELTTAATLNFTALNFTDSGTRAASDYTLYTLYYVNTGGGGSLVQLATSASPATGFSGFSQSIPAASPQGFVIGVNVPGTATNGNTFLITVANADVTMSVGGAAGGPINGNVHTISNTGTTPGMTVEDSFTTVIPSGVGTNYDLAAAHGNTPLTGQTYTFTIDNPGTATLNLTNTAPDYIQIAQLNNCTVTPNQPSSGSIAVSGSANFGLQITPSSAAAFSFRVVIQNNSPTNPYTFNVQGTGTSSGGAATQLAITTQPGGGTGGIAWAQQPVVEARDGAGTLDTSYSGAVVAVITTSTGTSGATLLGTVSVNAVGGVASFSNLAIDLAGSNYQLDFSSGALTPTTSGGFNIAVGAGAALRVITQPGNGTTATPLTVQPVVEIIDAGGNRVATDSSTLVNTVITFGTGTGGAVVSGTVQVQAASGVVTYTNLEVDLAGVDYRLDFQDSGATFQIVVSDQFDVSGAATQLSIHHQPGGAAPGVVFTMQPHVEIQDASGIVVATDNSTQVTVSITSGTGTAGAILSGTTTLTAVNGVVDFSDLSIDLAGNGYTLDFDDGGALTDATSSAFSVSAGGGGGGGGDGGGDSGCSTGTGHSWLLMLMLLGLVTVGLRQRRA